MQILLHIGQQKTASTSIQMHLAANRGGLARQGILYPSTLGTRKTSYLKHLTAGGSKLPASREELSARLRAEFAGDYTKAVISDETIFPAGKERSKLKVKAALDGLGTSWRVLCYVRRPDEHIVSQFQQKVRNASGDSARLDFATFDDFYLDRLTGDYYRYAMHMENWEKVFGKGSVEVRVFHRSTLQGSPVSDFIQWIGADPERLAPEDRKPANESLDRISTEILLFLSYYRRREPDRISQDDVSRALATLRPAISDDRMRLDYKLAKQMHERFAKDHERLAARYLSPEHAAILLAPPVERPPQPPLEAEVIHQRVMALFGDAELAQTAAEAIANRSRRPRVRRENRDRSLWSRFRKSVRNRFQRAKALLP
jgi:hypothetical protein